MHPDLQSSNTLNGGSVKPINEHIINMSDDEEDEDAFHDDLPEIKPNQQRYLIQKYATLWFNKIKPGMNCGQHLSISSLHDHICRIRHVVSKI